MPAKYANIIAGIGFWLYTVNITQASNSRSFKSFTKVKKSEVLSLSNFTQGASQTITSSTNGSILANSLPLGDVRTVMLVENVCFKARMAGLDIIKSPILSSRIQRIFLQIDQSVFILSSQFVTWNHGLFC